VFSRFGKFEKHFLDFGFGLARGLPGIDLEFEKMFFNLVFFVDSYFLPKVLLRSIKRNGRSKDL
jgi:hypothetical protein